MTQLDRLEALAEKATERPWRVPTEEDDQDLIWLLPVIMRVEIDPTTDEPANGSANADLMVAAVNLLGDLIRVARAAKAFLEDGTDLDGERLEKALAPLYREAEQ